LPNAKFVINPAKPGTSKKKKKKDFYQFNRLLKLKTKYLKRHHFLWHI